MLIALPDSPHLKCSLHSAGRVGGYPNVVSSAGDCPVQVGIVGCCEMGVDAIDLQTAARRELRQRVLQIVVTQPEPVHAGINLEVTAEPNSARGRGSL